MNNFTKQEEYHAVCVIESAKSRASDYADFEDHEAATIALLLRVLELAGGKHFIKPQGEQ